MYRIVRKEVFSPRVKMMEVEAPRIARRCQPGEFLIVMKGETSERIPLTIADFDRDRGTVTLVFQEVGKSTLDLGIMEEGDALLAVMGPLGHPSDLEGADHVVCIGGGLGIAPVHPIARAYKQRGARVTAILGARTRDLLYFRDRMRAAADELIICTDDGSEGRQGVVTQPLQELIQSGRPIDRVVAIGPAVMMKFVCATTREHGIPTVVSLNSIMVDGTGMCGGCRVIVGAEAKFCCVDGPEFDGLAVDWGILLDRQKTYCEQEKCALDAFVESHPGLEW
ncbi:MAG: sulfide/dihydroorotate dehydrogenase-like FAD/NAD-binding protein [Gemmatimonadota bacterium]